MSAKPCKIPAEVEVSVLARRLRSRSITSSVGCWLWQGSLYENGYGQMWNGSRPEQAHRISFREFVGEIPEGKEIDHVCKVRRCVNPAHLQAVTHRENILRSNTAMGMNARKTHCIRGHEFAGDNLRIIKGARQCRKCMNFRAREARKRK